MRCGVSYFATPRTAAAKGGGWLGLNAHGGLRPQAAVADRWWPEPCLPSRLRPAPAFAEAAAGRPEGLAVIPLPWDCRCFAKPVHTGFCERKTDRCSLPPQGAGSSDPAGLTKLHKCGTNAEAPGMTRTALDAVAPGGGRASLRCGRHERRSRSAFCSAAAGVLGGRRHGVTYAGDDEV